jgi:hypothetical protein
MGAVAGTTLIHIGRLYNATTGDMSVAVTVESAGCLIGALVYNSLIQRVKFEFAVIFCVWLAATVTVFAPFVSAFPAFIAAVAVRGLASAVFTLSRLRNVLMYYQQCRTYNNSYNNFFLLFMYM